MILIYKVATTGLVQFKLADDHPSQPHLVHVAALLCTDSGRIDAAMDRIVQPLGWEIPRASTAFHGVSEASAVDLGLREDDVLAELLAMDAKAAVRVAHNESFDSKVVRIAMARYPEAAAGKLWEKSKGVCSMKTALDYLTTADPKTFWGRQAKIADVFEAVLGEPYPYGIRATAWVHAVKEIYFKVARQQLGEAA